MKTRYYLFMLWLFALVAEAGALAQAADDKGKETKPKAGQSAPGKGPDSGSQAGGSGQQGPLAAVKSAASATGTGESVASDIEVITGHLSALDAKLNGIDEKLLQMSEPDDSLGKMRLLLFLVLGLTSFTFIIMARSLYERIKARSQPRSSEPSNEVLLQQINELKNHINALRSGTKPVGGDADQLADKGEAVTMQFDEEQQPATVFEERPAPSPAYKERPSSSPASIFEERHLPSPAPFFNNWSAASPDTEPRLSEPPVARSSFNNDPSILVRAQVMGGNFREAILQNGGKFQAGWETFKRSLPREIETEDVWYDLAANEKVLTFQPTRMGNAVPCRVVIIGSQECGRRGLLFISHIGEFYPRIEDFLFCDVRATGPVQRDRLLSYLPPVVACMPGGCGWEVVRRGEIEYN